MIPALLETGRVCDRVFAIRDRLVNFYVVQTDTGLACIDTGWSASRVRRGFASLGLDVRDVREVFLTHRHWDHAGCVGLFANATVFIGNPDRPVPEGWQRLRDGDSVRAVLAVATPGHTPDSISYLVDGRYLFTGDAVRLRQGRAVPFYACFNQDRGAVHRSLEKLARLSGIEYLLTGHSGFTGDVAGAFRSWRSAA
ncbi:MAG TPA: MBL fold metallo-hydrolase [Verrucomicrobiae bacterium]|nr:MBL fold metallo-hydrolase [Verrucomicrobiae bacterium]